MAEEAGATENQETTETSATETQGSESKETTDTSSETSSEESSADPKDEKGEQEASGKESEEERVVPEKYDLKLSEDSLLDESALSRLESYAKTQGLTQKEAEEFLKTQEAEVSAFMKERADGWKKQALEDKEIGGANLKENIALASRAIDKYATPALKSELDRSGYGNHPELVRMFARIGKEMADDKAVFAGHKGQEKSVEDIFYPKKEA